MVFLFLERTWPAETQFPTWASGRPGLAGWTRPPWTHRPGAPASSWDVWGGAGGITSRGEGFLCPATPISAAFCETRELNPHPQLPARAQRCKLGTLTHGLLLHTWKTGFFQKLENGIGPSGLCSIHHSSRGSPPASLVAPRQGWPPAYLSAPVSEPPPSTSCVGSSGVQGVSEPPWEAQAQGVHGKHHIPVGSGPCRDGGSGPHSLLGADAASCPSHRYAGLGTKDGGGGAPRRGGPLGILSIPSPRPELAASPHIS